MLNPETGEQDGSIREQVDSRKVPGDMYISQDEVDKWAKEFMAEMNELVEEVCLFFLTCDVLLKLHKGGS